MCREQWNEDVCSILIVDGTLLHVKRLQEAGHFAIEDVRAGAR